MMSKVGVISCAHAHWLRSSRVMGRYLALAAGYSEHDSLTHVPIDRAGFAAVFPEAELEILHTHGTPLGLYDQRADGGGGPIVTLEDIERLPRAAGVRLVVITACEAAGGDPAHNLASVISTRISPSGLVIANRHVVWGEDYDFGEKTGKRGWVAYRDGRILLTPEDIPAAITMKDAYELLLAHENG